MTTDYEKVYQGSRCALGEPTKEFVDFFESCEKRIAWVLDLGCGQGRDALFNARLGHRVTAVDLAKTGIRHLVEDAEKEALQVEALVADVRTFRPSRSYDVIVIDRTLHMLGDSERIEVLRDLLPYVAEAGAILIADERKNISSFQAVFDGSEREWTVLLAKRGFLFVRRTG